MTSQIVSLSGGKDSTAMLHMMLERGERVEAVVFFDTGWEFPEMHEHIDLVEKKTGLNVWRLHPRIPFEYRMIHRPVKTKSGEIVYGWGWPSNVRWCTRQKIRCLDHFAKPFTDYVHCIGFACDEMHRASDINRKRYPLIEYGVTEKQALQYCLDLGYTWGGLYDHFDRVSCFCCPQKKLNDFRKIRKHFPDLWAEILRMDKDQPKHTPGFKGGKSVHDFEKRFAQEDRQFELFEV